MGLMKILTAVILFTFSYLKQFMEKIHKGNSFKGYTVTYNSPIESSELWFDLFSICSDCDVFLSLQNLILSQQYLILKNHKKSSLS